ncbi:MFS transporter [Agrococcus jejuensis]|uniref:Predicted arabinose efflux permease, MFS family n=1 Tax=Agrococcus jejuensis TaxID=399736 RepID=A0A1G8EE03_9MICO|nr:MFS transporter [Agrococcus jejuensis]SDH68142.1 Predicted arabinose efflux permease, MFS family [Agrococcus jejuensis]
MAASDGDARVPRSFRWLLAAESASSVGTYVTLLALQTIVVVTLGGDSADTGLLSAARWLPYLVVGLLVGALVDRMRRKPVMVWSDAVRAVLLAAIPALWVLDALTLPTLLVVVVAYGVATVVNDAASMAFLPRLVSGASLQAAHARIDTADAVAQSGGPALGGLVVRLVGAPFAVLVDAVASAFAALAVARIRVDEPEPAGRRSVRGILADVGEGIRLVYRGTALTRLAVATHVWFAANATLGVLVAPFALTTLGLDAGAFGIVLAAAGVGAVVGASVTGWVGRRLGALPTVAACHGLSTVAVLVMAAAVLVASSPSLATVLLGAGQLLHGIAMGASNSHEMAYRQTRTPDEAQARVNMTMRAANRAVIVVVAPIAGFVAVLTGLLPMLAVSAALFATASLAIALRPRS